jgi:endonuclease YncB( thermonuclease family)
MIRWIFGFVLLLAAGAAGVQHVGADFIDSRRLPVIDGDTIKVDGKTIYLAGFVAPEMQDARCAAERSLGIKATRRMRDLILAGGLDYSPAVCSCRATTLGRWFCNFGRACGTLKANGRDVGDILIEEGLAVPYSCGAAGCPKAPQPWCKSSQWPALPPALLRVES